MIQISIRFKSFIIVFFSSSHFDCNMWFSRKKSTLHHHKGREKDEPVVISTRFLLYKKKIQCMHWKFHRPHHIEYGYLPLILMWYNFFCGKSIFWHRHLFLWNIILFVSKRIKCDGWRIVCAVRLLDIKSDMCVYKFL